MPLSDDVRALLPDMVALRRELHQHPELAYAETRTAARVAGLLEAAGLEVRTGVGGTGVIASLRGSRGPAVLLRADMDALPIQETIDVPYKSQVPGVKHACGHDVHTTVELGVAEVLAGMKAEIPGTIKFIFQPRRRAPPPARKAERR